MTDTTIPVVSISPLLAAGIDLSRTGYRSMARPQDDRRTAQEPRRRLDRWEEVIFPAYTLREPTPPSQRVPRWLQRQRENGAKDLTGYIERGE